MGRSAMIAGICQEWVFGEINSVDLLCVKITSLGKIAMEENPTSQSAKRLGSVPKYMRTIVKPKGMLFQSVLNECRQGYV